MDSAAAAVDRDIAFGVDFALAEAEAMNPAIVAETAPATFSLDSSDIDLCRLAAEADFRLLR